MATGVVGGTSLSLSMVIQGRARGEGGEGGFLVVVVLRGELIRVPKKGATFGSLVGATIT
jgi:hypothetical protein